MTVDLPSSNNDKGDTECAPSLCESVRQVTHTEARQRAFTITRHTQDGQRLGNEAKREAAREYSQHAVAF